METSALALPEPGRHQRIAAPLHTAILLAAQAGLLFLSRMRAHGTGASGAPNHIALYERTMLIQWLLFGFVILGVWRAGSPLTTVLGERWRSLRMMARDIGIGVLFLIASIMLESILGSHLHGAAPN